MRKNIPLLFPDSLFPFCLLDGVMMMMNFAEEKSGYCRLVCESRNTRLTKEQQQSITKERPSAS
jgi:hypothetical protein